MPRVCSFLTLLAFLPILKAAEPSPVEKQLAIQTAMAAAEQYLQAGNPSKAAAILEADLSKADGNKAFLAILKRAYLSELSALMNDPMANASRLAQVRRNLDLLVAGNPTVQPPALPAVPSPAPAVPSPALAIPSPAPLVTPVVDSPATDPAAEAKKAFKKEDYEGADRLFASLDVKKLSPDQKAAWTYCRVKIGAGKVNSLQCDCATAAAVEKDVAEALKLVPQHLELQKIGQQVIAAANLKANSREGTAPFSGPALTDLVKPAAADSGDTVETASFRVRHTGARQLAESVAKAAETSRKAIFERWSGPPSGAWEAKCEIVIHPTAEAFARATNRQPASTGLAFVKLTNSRPTERRIELRADDPLMIPNALPRELTHIVLADLFPDKPPPRWAEEGMAVLAGSTEEIGRYTGTLRRCARDGEWYGLPQLLEMKDYPTEKVTGFYCESVALTEYLVRAHGERNFTIFLRDSQRYGIAQSLRRQYGIDGPQALETVWKRSALELSRGQAP